MCAAAGVSDRDVAFRIIVQMAGLQTTRSDDVDQRLLEALTMLEELKPGNAMESLLAVQMIHVHEAAVKSLQLATVEGQTEEGRAANVLRAVKLVRIFIEMLTAMQKLRGKPTEQRVTVEHVHVHEGGQAIVGAVAARTGVPEGFER
jgi:hypothetical protein